MEGLRQLCESGFRNEISFDRPPAYFSAMEIFKPSNGPTTSRQFDIVARSLLSQIGSITSPKPIVQGATLQLVGILRSDDGKLLADSLQFRSLVASFGFDPYMLYMLGLGLRGSQHFRSTSTQQQMGHVDSFYINSVSGTLLWSYDSCAKNTRAILIPRPSNSIRSGPAILDYFLQILESQKALIDNPWLLQLVTAIDLSMWLDTVLKQELKNIRMVEERTRHGSWDGERKLFSLDELKIVSERIGFSVSALANAIRQSELILELLNAEGLRQEAQEPFSSYIDTNSQTGADQGKEVAKLIRQQTIMRQKDILYLQDRAKNQTSVVFSLISQKDAQANLDIAAAARVDSGAMKLLAVITTFFLPGTFFATLFALPTLQWTQPTVISDRFWIYWAFVLPSTVLLLLLYKAWQLFQKWKNPTY